jgi:hypothetical protein
MLIPSRIQHHRTDLDHMESFDCVVPLAARRMGEDAPKPTS